MKMKIRTGFVSNSSSSSFVCAVTGEIESGMDMCLSEINWIECENGHAFHEDYLVEPLPEDMDDSDENGKHFYLDHPYEIPSKHCPVCTMKNFEVKELLAYMIKTNNLTLEEIQDVIRSNMKTYDDFKGFINGVKIR